MINNMLEECDHPTPMDIENDVEAVTKGDYQAVARLLATWKMRMSLVKKSLVN